MCVTLESILSWVSSSLLFDLEIQNVFGMFDISVKILIVHMLCYESVPSMVQCIIENSSKPSRLVLTEHRSDCV